MTAPGELAFDSADNLFVGDNNNGKIYEYKNGLIDSTPIVFASGLSNPTGFALQFMPAALNIASVGNQSVLYWPAWASHFTLQTATNLSSPNWVMVTNGTPIIGVMLTNTQPSAFFRLIAP